MVRFCLIAYYGAEPFGVLLHLVCIANAGIGRRDRISAAEVFGLRRRYDSLRDL